MKNEQEGRTRIEYLQQVEAFSTKKPGNLAQKLQNSGSVPNFRTIFCRVSLMVPAEERNIHFHVHIL
jgi:hypothetical protein